MSKKKGARENIVEYKGEAELVEVEALDIPDRLCNVFQN